jgi:hypothetical protein
MRSVPERSVEFFDRRRWNPLRIGFHPQSVDSNHESTHGSCVARIGEQTRCALQLCFSTLTSIDELLGSNWSISSATRCR